MQKMHSHFFLHDIIRPQFLLDLLCHGLLTGDLQLPDYVLVRRRVLVIWKLNEFWFWKIIRLFYFILFYFGESFTFFLFQPCLLLAGEHAAKRHEHDNAD